MATFSDLLGAKLAEAIREEIREIESNLGAGTCADFAEYKYRAGQVHGLNRALLLLEDVHSEIQKR